MLPLLFGVKRERERERMEECGGGQGSPEFRRLCDRLASSRVDTVELCQPNAPPLDGQINYSTFVREYVAKRRPCIIKGLTKEWDALTKWRDDDYFFGSEAALVTCSLTPNGRADCVTDVTFESDERGLDAENERLFMSPAEIRVPMAQVRAMMHAAKRHNCEDDAMTLAPLSVDLCGACARRKFRPKPHKPSVPVPYCQLQNNSLETEFSHLKCDLTDSVSNFGREVFGVPIEASNVWVGTSLSVTSLHQDWYENLYAVVRGQKTFLLIPPWESPLLIKERLRSAKYCTTDNGDAISFAPHVEFAEESIAWIGVDLEDSPEHQIESYCPGMLDAHPIKISVDAGEVLYLPAMWFHRVSQMEVPDGDTCVIGVNHWFDMQMDTPVFHLIQYVCGQACDDD